MWLGLQKRFKRRKEEKKNIIEESRNVVSLGTVRRTEELVRDALENGVVLPVSILKAHALVYLYFDGALLLRSSDQEALLRSVSAAPPVILSKIADYFELSVEELLEDLDEANIQEETAISLILLNQHLGMLTLKLREANAWFYNHEYELRTKRISSDSFNGYFSWLEGEVPANERPSELEQLDRLYTEEFERKKISRDPIYAGELERLLIAPRPELEDDLSWWALQAKISITKANVLKPGVTLVLIKMAEQWVAIAKARNSLKLNERENFSNRSYPEGVIKLVKLCKAERHTDLARKLCEEAFRLGIESRELKRGITYMRSQFQDKDNTKQKINPNKQRGKLSDKDKLAVAQQYFEDPRPQARKELAEKHGLSSSHLAYTASVMKKKGLVIPPVKAVIKSRI